MKQVWSDENKYLKWMAVELAAWTLVAGQLFNLDEIITR